MESKPLTLDEIQSAVCQHYGVTPEDLRSRCRKAHLVQARQMAMYLAREHTAESRKGIGIRFGQTRSGVDWAQRRVKGFIEVYPAVRRAAEWIVQEMTENAGCDWPTKTL